MATPPKIDPEEQLRLDREERDAWKALLACPGWTKFFTGLLARKKEEHAGGMAQRGVSAEKRSEHVEAWHLAGDLAAEPEQRLSFLRERIAKAEREGYA